jgi:hypothetical protein
VEGAGTRFVLGRVGKEPSEASPDGVDDGEANDIALPFSPEVGTATAFAGGFAVGALIPARGGATAVVVVLSPEGGSARKIELGKVHGDVPPPRVAASGSSLVLAVPDGAPHGSIVRLSRIDLQGTSPSAAPPLVIPGAEVPQGPGESEAIALEVGKNSALLAWDEWDAKVGHEVIKAVAFSPSAPEKTEPVVVVSPRESDAEAPRLARRASGFWAAWIVTTHPPRPSSRPRLAADEDRNASEASPRSGGGAVASASHGGKAPVNKGQGTPPDTAEPPEPRYIALAPLDANGALAGTPLAVSPRMGHVAAFDLAPARDDGALVVWRDAVTSDEQTPGGTVRLALVRADGSVEPRAMVEEDVGSGVPLLLSDDATATDPLRGGTVAFMAVAGDTGAVRLASLDESGRGKDVLGLDPALGVATPLAARNGVLFVARPHGSGLELGMLACSAGPPP